MPLIPQHIRHLKFLKILKNSKATFEREWPLKPELHMTAEQADSWVATGNNYGVIGGPITGVGMIDCDHPEYILAVENNLPQTFSVQSSSNRKRHFYYKFINFPTHSSKFSLIDPDNPDGQGPKDQGGDIRNGNFYVVGPGSIHPDTGTVYTVIDDVPIATIDYGEVFELFHSYYKSKEPMAPAHIERRNYPLPISRVIEHYEIKMKSAGRNEFFCAHPVHGSTNAGTNFGVNTVKNVWCCRRCNSGGGVVHLVAMMERLIDCADAKRELPEDVSLKVLSVIKEKFDVDLSFERKAPLNDTFNANLFAKRNISDTRYCTTFKAWYHFNGQIWEQDKSNIIRQKANDVYVQMTNETPVWVPVITPDEENDAKIALVKSWKSHVKSSGENSRLENMVCVSTKDLSIQEKDFDKDPNIICLKNGVFDLDKFILMPFNSSHMVTQQARFHYDPNAQCPNWQRLMKIVFLGDDQLIRYFQKALGYCLTADISRQMFFVLHGGGSNGKSTIMDTIKYGLGDYAASIRSQSLLAKKDDAIPNDWAALNKKRLVVASELEQNKELDTAIVKQFTSKKPMQVRFLNKEFFEMESTFKVFLETNPLPRIKGDDDGTWRRIKKIPFMHKFSEADKVIDYDTKYLYPELSGIFNWLLYGLKDLRINGEQEPEVIKLSTQEYRENENSLHDFIERHCKRDVTSFVLASDMWIYYKKVIHAENDKPYGKHNFPQLLEACGIKRERVTSGEHKGKLAYFGIRCVSTIHQSPYNDTITPPPTYFIDPFGDE